MVIFYSYTSLPEGIYIYMGVSENVVYPNQPNGFADHEIPFLNGYFIGNIAYFQTNPYVKYCKYCT